MPYYIGDVITDETKLIARTPEQFQKTGVNVRLNTQVDEIDTDRGVVRLSHGESMPYDMLVMGTGSEVYLPEISGLTREGVFKLKNLRDAIDIKEYIRKKRCRKAVIIGAGFIAMEMSEAFRNIDIETVIVHRTDLPVRKWDPEFSQVVLQELIDNQVTYLANKTPVAVERGSEYSLRLLTNDGKVEGDIILLATGVQPNTELAEDIGLEMGTTGSIKVNLSQKTSREEIYAVGDCCEVFNLISRQWTYMPLGDIANKQGRVAGRNIGGNPLLFPGAVYAMAFQLFNLEVAMAGLDEIEARESGFYPVSTIIWGTPVARSLSKGRKLGLKLIADKSSGKLLGAQAVGEGGAASRINVLASCLWAGMDLDDIGYMDLAYAPPFGGSWDPIHIAAQSLRKKL